MSDISVIIKKNHKGVLTKLTRTLKIYFATDNKPTNLTIDLFGADKIYFIGALEDCDIFLSVCELKIKWGE